MQRTKTLETSLEVMALEAFERLRLLAIHKDRIADEKEKLYELLQLASRQVVYRLRNENSLRMFYERIFTLRSDERKQEVECWRDIVMVIHALLPVWQQQQQAKSRSMLLEGVYEG